MSGPGLECAQARAQEAPPGDAKQEPHSGVVPGGSGATLFTPLCDGTSCVSLEMYAYGNFNM